MKLLNSVLLIVLLSGCATQTLAPKANIPASLIQPCEPLEELSGMTGKDLLTNITNNSAVYWRCFDKHNALIEAVKPEQNK